LNLPRCVAGNAGTNGGNGNPAARCAETEYDALDIAGELALDGTLNVSLADLRGGRFAPSLNDSFAILDWGSRSGTFDTPSLPSLDAGLMWNATQLYTTGALSIALAGDYNFDGVVNAADFGQYAVSEPNSLLWLATGGMLLAVTARSGPAPVASLAAQVDSSRMKS
jgi:hypothetical protein